LWVPFSEFEVIESPFTKTNSWNRPLTLIGRVRIRDTAPTEKSQPSKLLPLLCNASEVSSFVTQKRYEEHVAGRWLLGKLLEVWGINQKEILVQRDENRAPILVWKNEIIASEDLPSISIGHSEGWAVVAICNPLCQVGIDAEPKERLISDTAFPLFSTGEELENIQQNPEYAIPIWTAKEAVQKALRLGMHLNPRKVSTKWPKPIEKFSTKIPIGKEIIQLESWGYKDIHISLALAEV